MGGGVCLGFNQMEQCAWDMHGWHSCTGMQKLKVQKEYLWVSLDVDTQVTASCIMGSASHSKTGNCVALCIVHDTSEYWS